MSEQTVKSSSVSGATRRDGGFTLPELLVSIIVLGSIVAVLSSAIIVTFRQRDNTEGRLNVSRAEQAIDTWIPADLASAGSIPRTEAWMSPCGLNLVPDLIPVDATACPAGVDLSGSNALFLKWTNEELMSVASVMVAVTTTTQVSYHGTTRAGGLFDLVRIECQARDSGPLTANGPWTCDSITVLHDLPGPTAPVVFVPGETEPYWVLSVNAPLPPSSTGTTVPGPTVTYVNDKNASRVIVTVTGGGDLDGGGGGINQISITAGGTTRNTLDPGGIPNAPSFTTTKSRCGGPLTLIVDSSGSIGSTAMGQVKTGVKNFITALSGTPVQVQIVEFDTEASVLGATGSEWTKYYNMLDPTQVTALKAAADTLVSSDYTNWEDAWFRTFYTSTGDVASIIPQTVVFFTDGIPSWDRTEDYGSPGAAEPTRGPTLPKQKHGNGWPALDSDGYPDFNQVAFNRAEHWIQDWRPTDTRLIGVGVGPAVGTLSTTAPSASDVKMNGATPTGTASLWMDAPGVGYHMKWERGSRRYQVATTWSGYKARYWTRPGTSGSYTTPVTLAVYNATASNQRQDNGSGAPTGWPTTNSTEFNNKNTTADNSDGFRRYGAGNWQWVTTAEYVAAQGTKNSDAYRDEGKEWSSTGPDWEPSGSGTTSSYRSTKTYTEPELHDLVENAVMTPKWNAAILSRFITGSDTGAIQWNGINQKDANMYIAPNFAQFGPVLQAIALGECGATLTLQTKQLDGTPATRKFTYDNTALTKADGVTPLFSELTYVETTPDAPAVTFDLNIVDGTKRFITFVPRDVPGSVYTEGTWACMAGDAARFVEPVAPADGSLWTGMKVEVGPNEAVSCIHTVEATP